MTMMMTSSQFGLEDMEDLLWGPSSPMADAMDSMFFSSEREENREGGGNSPAGGASPASPLASSSLSSSSSPSNFYSPPPSPPPAVLHGDKAGTESDLLAFPWLEHPDPLRSQTGSDHRKEDRLGALDWMAEKIDLSDLDLDSLIGPCGPTEDSSTLTDDLLASLDCPMELDSLTVPYLPDAPPLLPTPPALLPPSPACQDVLVADESDSYVPVLPAPSPPPCVPDAQEELEIKSEPASPDPDPPSPSPSSPVDTLELGSEVDVSESEVKPVFVVPQVPQVQRIVFSLSPTRIVLVLAPKNEVGIPTATVNTTAAAAPSPPEVIRASPASSPPPASPPPRSSRGRPYPEPKYKAAPPSPDADVPATTGGGKVKSLRGADDRVILKVPKDKKMKKMEQNKTAATRYRQKKRVEQVELSSEHSVLERKNMELKEKAESMAREIQYLKELMDEVRLARVRKGLSPDP